MCLPVLDLRVASFLVLVRMDAALKPEVFVSAEKDVLVPLAGKGKGVAPTTTMPRSHRHRLHQHFLALNASWDWRLVGLIVDQTTGCSSYWTTRFHCRLVPSLPQNKNSDGRVASPEVTNESSDDGDSASIDRVLLLQCVSRVTSDISVDMHARSSVLRSVIFPTFPDCGA